MCYAQIYLIRRILLCMAILLLEGCEASSPDMSPSELDAIAKESQIYCGTVEVKGILAENLARLKSKPTCEPASGNAGPAIQLSANDRISASDSDKLGVPFELSVSAAPLDRPLDSSDLQPLANSPDYVSGPAPNGNGTTEVPIKRIGLGKETQYSTSETKIRALYATPYIETACVLATRIPQGRKPLWVIICRNVNWSFNESKYEEVLQAVIRRDLPLISSAN